MLSINYTYYNNLDTFKLVRDHYLNLPDYGYQFNIADDGSKDIPLPNDEVPKEWNHYLIEDDIGFNNEGARNLLMQQTKTKWNVCIDMDRVISPTLYNQLKDYMLHADENKLHRFMRVPNANTKSPDFLTTKDYFWSMNGYAESYKSDNSGYRYYGCDITLLNKSENKFMTFLAPLYTIEKQYAEPPIDKNKPWINSGLKPFDDGLRVNFKWKKINANISN